MQSFYSPVIAAFVLPEAQIATPRHIKLGSGFFLSFFKKNPTKHNRKRKKTKTNQQNPKHKPTTKPQNKTKKILQNDYMLSTRRH